MNDLKDLERRVYPYKKGIPVDFAFSDILSTKHIYIGIPIVILALLIVFRPSFVKTSETPTSPSKVSIQKIFISWFVISTILVLAIYAYNFKNKEF